MAETEKPADLTALTVELLSAYLANNTVGSDDLPRLIRETRLALSDDTASEPVVDEEQIFTPAVSIRKSQMSSAHLLSLIDGKPYKTLKRHLAANGLTPETYRERYRLPANYPMVAPDFAAKRRAIAEQIGLGNRAKTGISGDSGKPVTALTSAGSTDPIAGSKPAAVATPAVKSPTAKGAVPKSAEPADKAKRTAAPKPAKAKSDTAVAASEADKVTSVEPVAAKANAKPKRSTTSGATGAGATVKKRAAGKGAKADVALAPIKPAEPVQAANPSKAPRTKRMARAPKATTTDAG